ncbi:hypothetical protein CU097_006069, partial [Rhizopus azygosporus]
IISTLRQAEPLVIPETLLPDNTQLIPRLTEFINESITPIRNRLPVIHLDKATLSVNPQDIILVFRIQELAALANEEGRMFLNSIYTAGYTCRVSFAKRKNENRLEAVKFQLHDLNNEEIDNHFRACTVGPGRRDAFNSYHGGDDFRRLTTVEYYNASDSPGRMCKEDNRKIRNGLKEIETDVPTVKTANVEQFTRHIQYIFTNLDAFFNFYDFTVAEITWKNHRGIQKIAGCLFKYFDQWF